jgi:hypothetical protein
MERMFRVLFLGFDQAVLQVGFYFTGKEAMDDIALRAMISRVPSDKWKKAILQSRPIGKKDYRDLTIFYHWDAEAIYKRKQQSFNGGIR